MVKGLLQRRNSSWGLRRVKLGETGEKKSKEGLANRKGLTCPWGLRERGDSLWTGIEEKNGINGGGKEISGKGRWIGCLAASAGLEAQRRNQMFRFVQTRQSP